MWKTDIWPRKLGFPFPKSKLMLKLLTFLLSSKFTSRNSAIEKYFQEIKPDLVVLGDIQSPISFTYAAYAKKYNIKIVGNVRTWDHLTKNGPVVPGLNEYWVWNELMEEELNKFHNIHSDKINKVGSPQFDYYLISKKKAQKDLLDFYDVGNPLKKFQIDESSSLIFFGTNRPHRGIGEESIVHHICENISLGQYHDRDIKLILRAHPYDNTFINRFKSFQEYPFVKLFPSANLSKFNPERFRQDMITVSVLLNRSNLLICGQSTMAIDASVTDTPIINLAFDGKASPQNELSVKYRYNVDHYQKLLSFDGTSVAQNFDELDEFINLYMTNLNEKSGGRQHIREKFAGVENRTSSDRIVNNIQRLINEET